MSEAAPGGAAPDDPSTDDLGTRVVLPAPPGCVVSLVPSLTEALAATDRTRLAGATDYCTHPADLDVARVGGSRFPDLDKVAALRPDLVLANAEENRPEDLQALRQRGIPVWVTAPTTLAAAFGSLRRMLTACGIPAAPPWLDEARKAWASSYDGSPARRSAVIPIWRRPWRVLGHGTFGGDVLRQLGIANAFDTSGERYPKATEDELHSAADLVILPDEPYRFGPGDGPDAFPGKEIAYVSGRHLFWYGPSLVEARDVLERQLYR
jgi:ABC-type Fe3+-hydroxamate transport system substrate-binding protein